MVDINIKGMFMNKTTSLLSKALDIHSARQEVISGNLANIDTPGYRPKDIDFEKELQRAMDTTYTRVRRTNPSHLSGDSGIMKEDFNPKMMITESKTTELNIDSEMAKMAQNNLLYEATARLLSNRLLALKTVIDGTGR